MKQMYKMDQQVVSKGSKLVAIIYWGLALLVSPIAIGGLLSFPNQAAAIGLVFLLISLFFLWAGFRQWSLSKQVLEEAAEIISLSKEASLVENKQPDHGLPIVWEYSSAQWLQFTRWEQRERRTNTFIEAFVLVVLGSLMIVISRGANWIIALLVSIVIAAIYYWLKIWLTLRGIAQPDPENRYRVIIQANGVLVNGRYHALQNQQRWLGKLTLHEKVEPAILEFTFHWNTRRGETFDELRIPVPPEAIAQAKWLVKDWPGNQVSSS